MVKSRKYAIVTAALALILVAAVVLTVVLVGDYTIQTTQNETVGVPTDLTIGGNTGSVDSGYVFQTLKAHSNKANDGWDNSELRTDGNISYFPATLNNSFYLITQSGNASDADNPGANVTATSSYYQIMSDGVYYRFSKNSGYSLYLAFETYMTATNYSQNQGNYGLAVQASGTISYNPNNTYNSRDFDATFDGAGVTLSMSSMLFKWDSYGTGGTMYNWIRRSYIGGDSQLNNNEYGLDAGGLLIASLRNGTLTNFTLTDRSATGGRTYSEIQSGRTLSGHYYEENNQRTGTAFGMVGYAGPSSSGGESSTNSYISNVHLDMTKNVLHRYQSTLTDRIAAEVDMYTGVLIGLNMCANVSNVTINMNSAVWDQSNVRSQQNFFAPAGGYRATSHTGVLIGMDYGGNTLEKIAVYGTSQAALVCSEDLWQTRGASGEWSKTHTFIGGVIGTIVNSATLNGVIFDFPFANNWYPQGDKRTEGAEIKRGIFIGYPKGGVTYQNIYVSDMVFTGSNANMNSIGDGKNYTCTPAAAIVNAHDQVESGSSASYTSGFWFDGNDSTNKRFIYLDDAVISNVQFSNDDAYMIEISAPSANEGVMWQVDYNWSTGGNINISNSSQLVYMQNARDNVQLRGLGVQGNNTYVVMAITYASSYDYVVSNGPNNNGTGNKVYDGTMVNYPTLDVNDNQVISSYGSDLLTSNGYLTLNASGSTITLVMNNGTQNIGNFGITNFYDANGTATGGNNMDNIVASVLQLENNTDGGYVIQNKAQWATMVNANTYRWSSIGLFAVETSNSDRKYVFSPAQSSSAELKIDQRPIYLDVVNDSVPYIGQGYRLEQGGDGSTFGVINYTFGTTASGNAIIGSDQVTVQAALSGDTASAVNAGTYSLSANNITGASANNYRLDRAPGSENSFTITPADVTLNITGGSMTYGTALESRTDFMNLVQYTLDFADETGLSAFASRDNITLNLNLQTGASATTTGALLFDPVQGSSVSGQRFAYNFPAGEYEVLFENISGSGAGNYNVTLAEGSQPFNINKAALHFDLSEIADFTYGDMALPSTSYSSGGLIGNDTIENSTVNYFTREGSAYTTTPFGAGNYYAEGNVTQINSPGSVNGLNNYDITYNRQSFEVSKRDTTVRFNFDPSKTYSYKGEAYDFDAVALGNPAFSDTAEGVTFQAYSDVNRETAVEALNAGTYYAGAVSDTLSANYNVTGITDMNGAAWETFTIGRATVTLSGSEVTNATYSGAPIPYDPSLITIDYGDVPGLADEIDTLKKALTYAYNGSSSAPVNAGTYNVTVSLPQQQNFNAATLTISGGLVIGQLAITITPDGGATVTVEYNGEMIPDLTYTVTGGGETITGLDITTEYYVGAEDDGVTTSNLRDVGTYTIVYSYDGTTGNYASTSTQVTYTVTQKSLTLTLNNANVTYNKEAFSPDYTVEGLITGDNAKITYTVAAHDGDVINAGTYEFTFSAGNDNYIISEESAAQTVVIAPYVLTAQALNTTVFFNSNDRTPGYYENQLKVRVLDADGTDITDILSGSITKDLIVSTDNQTPVTEVGERGGNYAVKVTITSLPEGYDANNYTLQPSKYAVFVYRIALGGKLTGGTDADSVTYGTGFDIKGVLTAMAGDKIQELTVNSDGNVDGIKGSDLTDVTSIKINSATFAVNGVTLALTDNTVTIDDIGADINTIFNLGVFDSRFANAGTYTATITITLAATYTDSDQDRSVTISAPFTWTVDPYEIQVTAGQLDKYYTEAITTSDVLGVVEVDEQYKGYITAVSSVIHGTSSTFVNAGDYTYDVVLNTDAPGYYNYTLTDVSTGHIVVSPLRLVVTVGNLTGDRSVQYGDAIAPTATAQLFKGDEPYTNESIASQYSWTTSSSVSAGADVGSYNGALTAAVKATDNFHVETPVAGNLEITQRMLGITLDDVTMAYSTGEIDVTYRITSGSLYGDDKQPVLVNYDITVGGNVVDLDRLAVNADGYVLNVQVEAFNNPNYGIASVAAGTLTVTPFEITTVTWNAPGQLVYKGAAFDESGELYTVENFVNDNGDVVTFSVSYGGEVKNAGSYSARVAVASVTNGADPVDAGNYSVANVAAQSFSVAKANLAVSEVGGVAAVDGAVTYTTTYNNSAKTISPDDIIFTFGDNLTYEEGRDGTLNVSVAYRQNGTTASTVNAGTYNVIITVSGDNFANANLTNVTMVIERWELTQKELATVADIDIPDGAVYDSQPHGASITFNGIFTGLNLSYTFTYTKDGETVDPVDAGSYIVTLVIDTANVYYSTADGTNEGTIVIAPTDRFTITASVPSSAGLDANEVYYTGAPIIPNAQADITVAGDVTQLIITDSAAFSFLFYEQLSPDDNGVDLSTLGYDGLPSGTYYVNPTPSDTAVSSGYYYVFVTFNEGSAYSGNYASGSIWITDPDGTLTSMQIVKGNMSVRVNSVSSDYNGLVGYNGRDVIYQTEDGKWMINTDLITFTGVDIAGMTDLTTDLKTGDIVITVSYVYGTDDTTGEQLATALYNYTWEYDSASNVRSTPVKAFLPEERDDSGRQVSGPYIGVDGFAVYDFGYSGYNITTRQHAAAVYRIDISVDNTQPGSEYSPARQIATDEDGQPIIVDGVAQTVEVPHTAEGSATVNPATVDFDMLYTNSFYNDGNDVLEGNYAELNTVGGDESLADYILRGIAIPEGGQLLTTGYESKGSVTNVTLTGYRVDLNNAKYGYEVLATSAITITVTDSDGTTVYTYANGVSGGTGIINAGTYTFEFEFAGMPGKYEPFTYTGTFVQQKAEYHITVTQKEGANLTTEFGVEFNVSDIADQLEVKVELGDGDYTTATGKYTAFETAVEQSGGNMSTLDSYIRLVGAEGGISTEYNTNTYKSNVGSYFIYYVYTSVDSNLEIVMETESSMIEVTKTAPSFMVNAEGERVDEKEGLDLGSQSYTPNTSWNDDVIRSVGLGIEYKSLEGLTGEYYTTKNVTIATIEYSADGDVWTNVEIIGSVGKYRVTIAAAGEGTENAEANLEGTLGGVYVFFEVTRISAQANVVVTGSDLVWSDEAGAYIATFNGNTHAIGYSVTAGGNAVSDSSLQGTVNILIAFTENAADGDYVDINTSPIVGAGSYWVKVTVTGSENYDVTPSDAVKITINKADPTIRFEQSEYNMTYSLKGNTIPAGDYSFELDGRNPAPDITAENSSVYYLSAPISGSGDVAGAQAQVAAMVNAFIASGAEDIVEWLKQNEGTYPGYKFTSVGETPAATDVGYYFPVVIFNGDDNYNRSGALVANVPHPVITVAKATLVLAVTIVDDMYVVYGSAPGEDISDTKEIGKYVSMDWSYTDADGGVVTVDSGIFGQIVSGFTYRLINCNQYVQGTAVGTVPNAYLFVVDSFESTNFRYTYDQGGYVNIQVTPATVAFDVRKGSVSLESDIADQAPVALTADGYTFNRVYSGGSFGPLKFDYSGEIGLDVNGDNAKKLDDRGFGDYGIFTVSASGGYTQVAVSTAGVYTDGSITITLNNTNYKVEGLEEGTLTLPVKLNIEKAIIQISFDYLTYAVGDKTYTEKSSAGAEEHLGWYEYATIYTGANFDYNNRVYVTSYRYGENGELVPYGAYSGGKRLGEVGGITESDGASDNLAAPGEYNIHLMLDQLATNYKFIDSAGNTLGQAADGSQADLSSLDINVTISPSMFVETGNSLAAGEKPLFAYADGVYSREFDGTDLTAAFLKTFLSVVPYKLSNTAGTLKGSIAAPNSQVQLTVDRDYAAELIGNNLIVELLSDGAAVDSAKYVGDYTLRVRLNNNAYSMDDMQFTLKITPASDIKASVSVKGQTARTYNGLDIVPNITLTLTVTDYNGNGHTIGVPSYTANVYKQVDGTTPDTPTFSYGVVNGDVDTAAINGKFTDAGTYIVRLVIDNPNVKVTELSGHDQTYTINARPLTDGSIRSTYEKLFSYRTTVNSGGEVVPVAVSAEDLKVLITYNRTTNLVLGEDFTIEFAGGAGQYTGNYAFTITGKGNFTGVIEGRYSIGASVGIVSAPDAITYGDDSVTVRLNINSLGSNSLAGDLTLNFFTGASSRVVDANDNTVAQLGVPSEIVISADEVSGNEFEVVFTGLGAVNAGEYFLDLVFSCTYAGITTEGTISRKVSGETASKVVVDEADVATAAAGVTATVTAVNSTTVSFNISGLPSAYEYSVDGGETWIKANKGSNTISGLTAGTAFNVLLRINDVNYASSENVHEYPLASALSFTTTASVDDIIASAESLANNFNATGFARYAQLLQNVASVSSGDLAARGDEIEEALAAVEEARAEYIEDLQAAIDSAVGAAEKAAGKASGVSGAATAGLVAGGVAMPVLGIGLIFAAARKRKSKEEDLND